MKGWIEEDNKFKSLSCHVRNNMESTLHINDYKFHKSGKQRNNKNWLANWLANRIINDSWIPFSCFAFKK